jgi:hypothetical protein
MIAAAVATAAANVQRADRIMIPPLEGDARYLPAAFRRL